MAVTVDQAKLILNVFMAELENNLVTRDIVSWKKHDGELDDRNALEVVEQVGPRYVTTVTTDGVKDLTTGVQDTVMGSERFKLNQTFGSSMGWGDFAAVRDISTARQNRAFMGAVHSMAAAIDASILSVAALASADWTGTIGTLLDDTDELYSGRTRMAENGVLVNGAAAVIAPVDEQKLSRFITGLAAPDAEVTKSIRAGFRGRLLDMDVHSTQQLPVLTTGTRAGTPLVNGAAQNVNYADVAVSGAPGRFMTQTIAIDGLGAGQTIKAGETFTIAGVFAYDNRKQAAVSPARLQQFVVVDDATATGGGAIAALRIYPAIIVPVGGASTGNNAVNTAHATVTAAPADDAAITYNGAASTAYLPRLVIKESAIEVLTKDLVMPSSDMAMRRSLERIPISVRMWRASDFNTGAHSVRFDCALKANIRERLDVVRINGV